MKILWVSWKDIQHSQSGGAEIVGHAVRKGLYKAGHNITHLTSSEDSSTSELKIDGIDTVRIKGNKFISNLKILQYYLHTFQNKFDLIVEEVNTAPFFLGFFKGKAKHVVFYHQLAREVWFQETIFPINIIGYLFLEPIATWLTALISTYVVTISQSTADSLIKWGFKKAKIAIVSEGTELTPLTTLTDSLLKTTNPTMCYFGSMRKMKRPDVIIKAFALAHKTIPNLKLWMVGGGSTTSLQNLVNSLKITNCVEFLGRVSATEKIIILQKAHILCNASSKEGWGLTITEAAQMGTPAIVYNVDGLRDAVNLGKAGSLLDKNTPEAMAKEIVKMCQNSRYYNETREKAFTFSKPLTMARLQTSFNEYIYEITK